jgi:heme-degrading monooxygenase HmoA
MCRTTESLTLINAFEVAPGDDERFIAGWQRARGFLAAREAFASTALHRALRADVDFRVVDLARIESPEAWRRAIAEDDFAGARMPFRAHAGLYEVVRKEGTPDIEGGVTLINPWEVPRDGDERFLAGWERAQKALATQRGHLGSRLHRSIGPAAFRFVDVGRWSSPLAYARALDRPDVSNALGAVPYTGHPALYQVIRA